MGRAALAALLAAMAALRVAVALDWAEVKAWVREEFPSVPTVSTAELARWMEEGKPLVLLDARTREEYAVSHLEGARHAPTERAALAALAEAPEDARVVVYCAVGFRSGRLAERLQARGYESVHNLEGSIFAWANEDRPLYRGAERVEVVHPYGGRWRALVDPRRWSHTP